MDRRKKPLGFSVWSSSFATFLLWPLFFHGLLLLAEDVPSLGPLVPKESRRTVVSTESGVITAVDVRDYKEKVPYHLQFITLDTSSLFLPVLLHADMVFYVHTGRGTVTWISEDESNSIDVERGDIYRIQEGNVFYICSHSDPTREKLRIHAIFNTITDEIPSEGFMGAYSNISDLVRGFDDKVLQMGFRVPEEVIRGIKWVSRPPSIVHFEPKNETDENNWKEGIFEALIGRKYTVSLVEGKKKKSKTKLFNLFDRKPDVKNCNGWSIAVTNRDYKPLRDSDIGLFMVNLTRGAMMGPHWNPRATEIAIVIHGQGMVQVVCPSNPSGEGSEQQFKCESMAFKVKEGDVFVMPRFHPMAQIAFNNDSFVFMGFTTMVSGNYPQFLAGKSSVLRAIDREILRLSFNATNTTLDRFLDSQEESIMLDCTSCAEELEEEIERKRQEEKAKREEEEAARRREEEEARRREEEEARKREEEAKREEQARKREEEEAKREEEEEERRKEEEAKREEEARRREEEAKREEEARKREEEAARKREQEEERRKEEEAREREREEERRQQEEEESREREQEQRREEEEEERRREEEEAREREQEQRREEEEEERRREEEEAREREKEERRRQEEERREEEEAREREQEEERRRQQEEEEEAWQSEKEEARKRKEEEARRRRREEEEEGYRQEEAKRRQTEKVEEANVNEEGWQRQREKEKQVQGRENSVGDGNGGRTTQSVQI